MMGENKHTFGPWYATTRHGSWDWLVAQSEQLEICQMFHDGTEFNEAGEANARLIAAAPDMLDALKEMLDDYAGWIGYNDDGFHDALIERARAAISKAQGGAE